MLACEGSSCAEVECADCARVARERLRAHRFDVLLSDLSMPDEDGFALLRSIRDGGGDNAAIPAAAVTARSSSRDATEAASSGFARVVIKPFEIDTLVTVVLALAASERRRRRRRAH